MSLTLARFGQEVDVATGSLDVAYFAVFQASNGRELKLPISEEASRTLINFFADTSKPTEKPTTFLEDVGHEHETPEEIADATTFGDEKDEEQEEETPDSEEQVPSV